MTEDDTLGNLLLLIDPAWAPDEGSDETPVESMIGAWLVNPDGTCGWFQPNPVYRPANPNSPLDPVDAVLGMIAREETGAAGLLPAVLADMTFGVALDEEGTAIVQLAPDGMPSVLVTTSYGHRDRVEAAGWRNTTLAELAAALPSQGVDVLLNPGASTSMRLLADAVREAAEWKPDQPESDTGATR
ncbi:type VII secretion system-associated protein [Kibdelosporangium phytohabitans]|uniref:SseB protein N-terminal domain-containing protein n=1 Tax=Kibdelosporangium phytohabitans TaxID=860235 RepID=A0A0N9I6G9_9PSEU|nr:type VII secretion system-associated protein [Kibdelosporangium phytohabitans]ALG10352.1 hypothetical protein AOZ06_28745 [Kibdelosporangium phytohabitans]MBE1461398.1 hypothetical protein [Kibdelosporangium phytohabitans]